MMTKQIDQNNLQIFKNQLEKQSWNCDEFIIFDESTKVKHASSNFQMNRGIRVAQFSREMFSYKNFLKRFVLQKIFSTDVFLQFNMFHSLSAVQLNHLETIPFVPFSLKSSSFTGSSCFRYF